MTPRKRDGQRGVSLIEVVVALTILSTVLVSLGALMYQVASHTRRSAIVTRRSAALQSSEAWVQGLAWDSIPGAVGCRVDTAGSFVYDRCMTYTTTATQLRRVSVVIVPTGGLAIRPDTLMVERARPRALSTLNR